MSLATISPDGLYRYHLGRTWGNVDDPLLTWVMLNPSTADAEKDDATVRLCRNFSRRWGFGHMVIVNLFAYRATKPAELARVPDPIGPKNDAALWAFTICPDRFVMCAWGRGGKLLDQDQRVLRVLRSGGLDLRCLGTTRDGSPRHPRGVPALTQPVPF